MQHRVINLTERQIEHIAYSEYKCGENNNIDISKRKTILRKAIANELTEKQRYCMYEHYINGRNMNEIAEELNVNPSTVTRHIQSAMKRIKRVTKYY